MLNFNTSKIKHPWRDVYTGLGIVARIEKKILRRRGRQELGRGLVILYGGWYIQLSIEAGRLRNGMFGPNC